MTDVKTSTAKLGLRTRRTQSDSANNGQPEMAAKTEICIHARPWIRD